MISGVDQSAAGRVDFGDKGVVNTAEYGLSRAGYAGSLAAWLGFTLPSAVALVLFAYGITALGGVAAAGWLHGLKVAAVAVVAQAVLGMMRSLAPDRTRATLAVIAAVIVLALPVIVLNSYKAVRNVNPSLVAMARSFLASRWQQILRIVLPDASPLIFAGLRLGIAAGFIGVVLAELLITPTGIGDLITYHRSVADYAEMYAVIVSIILFSAVTLSVLQKLEIVLFRPEQREPGA